MNSNKTISVLGCGWLGLELSKHLLKKGFNVKGSTTRISNIPNLSASGIDPFIIELGNNKNSISQDFFLSDILVLNIPPNRRNLDPSNNYPQKISTALQLAKKYGIRNSLLVSSTSVYASGNSTDHKSGYPIYKWDDLPNNQSLTARKLIQGEKIFRDIYGQDGTILRFAGLVGGERKAGRFLSGKKEIDNGLSPVNLIHRDDCIGIITNIIIKNTWGDNFNAASDCHPPRESFYTQKSKEQGFELPQFKKTTMSRGKIISNKYLKQTLDYTFIHPDPMKF